MSRKSFIYSILMISILILAISLWLSACIGVNREVIPLTTYTITNPSGMDREGLLIADFNEQYTVVGEFTILNSANFGSRAFMWQDDKIIDLGSFSVYRYLSARAVNNRQMIVGVAYDGNENNPEKSNLVSRAFSWQEDKFTQLYALGGKSSSANDVNDKGQIVGTADTKYGNYHACLWRGDKPITDLGTLGGKNSIALGINNKGEVVGNADTKSGDSHAFLWKDGKMQDLGTLGGKNSSASDVNDKGEVVGNADTKSGDSHAFLWKDGKMQDLGTLGGKNSSATGINGHGQIVGTSNSKSLDSHGWGTPATYFFIYNNGKMDDLNKLLLKSSEWTLEGNLGPVINDKGQIAGVGLRNGKLQGFILTPSTSNNTQ